jgi:sporulation protein YlmC with PRC-barrel domain
MQKGENSMNQFSVVQDFLFEENSAKKHGLVLTIGNEGFFLKDKEDTFELKYETIEEVSSFIEGYIRGEESNTKN